MKNNLPIGWEYPLLGEIVTIKSGNSSLTKKVYKINAPYIAFSGSGPDGKVEFFEEEGNAIILSAVGARCGKCFKATGKWTTIANTSIIRTFLNDEKHTDFLLYLLDNENFWPRGGSGQPFIQTGKAQKEKNIPLPPLSEQYRIVAKLDALMEKVESNKRCLDKIPALLKRFRQSVLAAAVSGRLTEDWKEKNGIKEEWKEEALKNIGEITGGITLNSKRQFLPLKMPYLRVANVYSNQVLLNEIKSIGITEKEINRALLKKGDLLIVEGNGSPDQIGRVAQWHGEIENCLHQNHLIKFRSDNYYTSRFILYFLLSFQGREQIEEASKSTSGLYTLSLSKVANLNIFFPKSTKEQKEIVHRVEQLFAFADKAEARYIKVKAVLDKLPQSILAKAFRGELVPQDPNDEPASVLLERIKAEKEMHGLTKNKVSRKTSCK